MKILLYVEYDGTAFHGYQRQKEVRTVQEELEKALSMLLGEEISVSGSSRTDAGVHARRYPVSFETRGNIPPEKIAVALNQYLPEDLKAQESRAVQKEFDARFHSRGKTYSYRFLRRSQPSALYRNYAYLVRQELDLLKMKEVAEAFLGTHDFTGFRSVGSSDPNPVKDMRDIRIVEEGEFLVLYITASGFLYNMARIIAGTLLDAGNGRITRQEVISILESGQRGKSMVLPPWGLYLEKVYYEENDL
ncbi:tRNA pseudouridine(38-40) synthase TruA [Proteiniclasticum sp. C24MP]|uniref:tRNA pseudouridine(38-40) synthase TruA n=1 Tax=Proteiniclasticum sp. C24MP TaxID=3374101 RepID=UPI003754080A